MDAVLIPQWCVRGLSTTIVPMRGANASDRIESAGAPQRRRRILIVAGEASGDLHGADLAREILARAPGAELSGIAGERMRAAGVQALVRTEDIAGLGLWELSATLGLTVRSFIALRSILRRQHPNLLILIDYAEFNLILAGVAKRAGVPVLYYITPQVWAWRRGRIRKLIERADRLAVVLPFEAELFAGAGERVSFVGHPLLERVAPAQGRAQTLARHGFPANARLIALLPGSRRAEARYMLRPMVDAARILARDHDLVPAIALAPTLSREQLALEGRTGLDGVRIIEGDTYSIIAASALALVTSGTATLETAMLGCPMVIGYKVSPLTYLLATMLITGVDYIGMPNILAGRKIVPELIQYQVTAANFVRAAEPLLSHSIRSESVAALHSLRERLGSPGAAGRVAELALGMVA